MNTMKRTPFKILAAAAALGLLLFSPVASQTQPIYDETFATDQAVSDYEGWSSNVLDIGTDSGTGAPLPTASGSIVDISTDSGEDGFSYSYFDTGDFTLDSKDSTVWTGSSFRIVNGVSNSSLRWDDKPPQNGIMLWLGGTDTNLNEGNGYFAGYAADSTLQLFKYTDGIDNTEDGTVTSILDTGFTPFAETGAFDFSVVFTAETDTFELFAADAGEELTSVGSITDSSYTGSTLVGSGFGASMWATNGTRGGELDAVSMTVIPEPSAFALLAGVLALGLVVSRRRSRA